MSVVRIPGISAPPSTAYKIVDVPENYRDVIQRHGIPGTFVGPSMEESPWVPFGDKAAIRHLLFDPRNNTFGNILWIKQAGVIGTHKHRGTVVMVCLEGSARYLEYDWVAHPGDFIYETPGLVHTLVSDHPRRLQAVRLAARPHRVLRRAGSSSPKPSMCGGSSTTTRPTVANTASRSTSSSISN